MKDWRIDEETCREFLIESREGQEKKVSTVEFGEEQYGEHGRD